MFNDDCWYCDACGEWHGDQVPTGVHDGRTFCPASQEAGHGFMAVFLDDLAPHQDYATNGAELLDSAIEVVQWYQNNDPENNVVHAEEADAFVAWANAHAHQLASEAERLFFTERA